MNGDEIFDAVEDIAGTSSTKAKLEKLKEYIQDDSFRKVCLYAYHPHYVYNIKDIPPKASFADMISQSVPGFYQVLDGLRTGSLSGNEALKVIALFLATHRDEYGELLSRVIRKDLRCGISRKTINKAYPNLLPEFPYMRCCLPKDAKLDDFDWENGCISQEKADGMFLNLNLEQQNQYTVGIKLYGREGNLFNNAKFKELVREAVECLEIGYQYHGELLVERDGKALTREIANGLINSANNGDYEFPENERVLYKMWDMIPLANIKVKKYDVPYRARFGKLVRRLVHTRQVNSCIGVIPTKLIGSLDEAKAHFKEMTSQGKEGTILKDGNAIWKDGTSKQQVKFKIEFDCDLEIVGFVEGQKATKNEGRVGSITCQSADGVLKVDVSIKGEAMRDAVDFNRAEWLGKIITVKANNIMPPTDSNPLYSLFLPRFVESDYRKDKSVADTLDRIQKSFDSAI